MPNPPVLTLPRKSLAAVLLVLICLLFLHAWLSLELIQQGSERRHAMNLARLITLPLLLMLVWLIVRTRTGFIRTMLSPRGLSLRLAITAIVVGVLARILAWAQLVFRASIGVLPGHDPLVNSGVSFAFSCPPASIVLVALFTWWFLVPFTEEVVHRGIIQSSLANYGPLFAIPASAIIFTLAHEPGNYAWVFLMGLLFGTQYWHTGVIWFPLITHAVYDGLIPLDTLCQLVNVHYPPAETPQFATASIAFMVGTVCLVLIVFCSRRQWIGPGASPIQSPDE